MRSLPLGRVTGEGREEGGDALTVPQHQAQCMISHDPNNPDAGTNTLSG